jgi:hypothetical protein
VTPRARPPSPLARTVRSAVAGALSGAVSAACSFLALGQVPGVELFGHCFGMRIAGSCGGIEGAIYLFPGLVFGLALGADIWWRGHRRAASVFALAALAANALAVFVCVALQDPLSALFGAHDDLVEAVAGAVAGAVGGGMLAVFTGPRPALSRRLPPLAAGAALGLLLPAVMEWDAAGVFVFYIVWQAGYAAALSPLLRPREDWH